VDRVGFDVLVEEVRGTRPEAQAAQRVGVAAVGERGGHLEGREVPDDRPAPAPVKPEERHEVDRSRA
jgi:hypothetical protein